MKTKIQLWGIAGCLLLAAPASTQAQPATRWQRGGNAASAPLQLPQGVEKLISIDAHNFLFVETRDPENPDDRQYSVIKPQHIYSGGIAQLFGGTVVSTAQFLIPGGANLGGTQRGVNVTGFGGRAWGGNFNSGGFGNVPGGFNTALGGNGFAGNGLGGGVVGGFGGNTFGNIDFGDNNTGQ